MIRSMTLADLETVLNWAADEGWNPGRDDATAFFSADNAGFFVAERDGRAVAAISVVNHDTQFAFLGLYLCHPAYRGRGIGYALWTHAIAHAGARTIGLDGVAAQLDNYAKSGFQSHGATLRLQGQLQAPLPFLREAAPDDFAAIASLDRAAIGYDRTAFLASWTAPNRGRRTVLIDDPIGICGFAAARLCRQGSKIGPVIAPDTDNAMALIRGAAALFGTSQITVDVPQANTALIDQLSALDFTETFRTARMFRGAAPVAGATLQAIATMELG